VGERDIGGKEEAEACALMLGTYRAFPVLLAQVTVEGVAEATAGQALVCGTTVLPTVAGPVLGEMKGGEGGCTLGSPMVLSGMYLSKCVRLVKVASSVKVGLKRTELKLGRGWKEGGSSDKVWYMALDWVEKSYHDSKGGVVEVAICNGSQVLHAEVLADVATVRAAEAVFLGAQHGDAAEPAGEGGQGGEGEGVEKKGRERSESSCAPLEVEVQIDRSRGTVAFVLNGRKVGNTMLGICGEVVLAAQLSSAGDRVQLLEASMAAPRSPGLKPGGAGGGMRWSVEDRVRILREKGNLAFKTQDYRHAVQVFSLALKLAPDNHVLFSNRSAAHLALGHFDKSIDDADKVCSPSTPAATPTTTAYYYHHLLLPPPTIILLPSNTHAILTSATPSRCSPSTPAGPRASSGKATPSRQQGGRERQWRCTSRGWRRIQSAETCRSGRRRPRRSWRCWRRRSGSARARRRARLQSDTPRWRGSGCVTRLRLGWHSSATASATQ